MALPSSCKHPTLGAGALDVKTLGPDLRLAFIASDAATSAALRLRLNAGSQWVSHLLHLTLACLTDEAFIASMTETRRHYRQQNEKLAAALARHGFSHATPGWPQFLAAADSGEPAAYARAGWLVREGEVFGIRTPSHGLRLSLGRLSDAEISPAADIAQALDAPDAGSPPNVSGSDGSCRQINEK